MDWILYSANCWHANWNVYGSGSDNIRKWLASIVVDDEQFVGPFLKDFLVMDA